MVGILFAYTAVLTTAVMLINYLRLVLRDFKRIPGYYLTNIASLAVGLSACLLITGYVKFHRSFDKQAKAYADTYRIQYSRWGENDDRVQFASASPTIGPAIKATFAEAESFARAYKAEGVFFYNEKFFKEEKVFQSETAIFDILGINILYGDKQHCLDDAASVVLSESTARKYFGDAADAPGKTLSMNRQRNLLVTAVFEDLPINMHIKADMFLSLNHWIQRDPTVFTSGWFYSGFYTYIKFRPGSDTAKINAGIASFIDKEFGKDLREYKMGISFRLQPLTDIHLSSHFMHELEANGSRYSVNLLAIVGWFILIIAWVNFFNLSTIIALRKQREIAIRKTNGASRRDLMMQLMVWSTCINALAIILALGIFDLVRPLFERFTGIPSHAPVWSEGWFYVVIAIGFLAGTLSAAVYSFTGVYSSKMLFNLKTSSINHSKGVFLKKGLITLQFIIGISLFAATIGVFMQYKYLSNKNTGFDLENILVVNAPVVGDATLVTKYKTFAAELKEIPGVKGCAFSSVIPGQSNMFNRGGIYRYGTNEKDSKNYRVTETSADFFNTYHIRFITGEGFTGIDSVDANRIVVNALAAMNLGFRNATEAVGNKVMLEGRPYMVSGVVIDFHQRSAKEAIEPQIFRLPLRYQGKFSINIGNRPVEDIMELAETKFTSFFPGNPFNAFMLKGYYDQQFDQEKQYAVVFMMFSMLVVFLIILGLIGLAAYAAEQRKKEIGIRKTLGASDTWLFFLLFRDYILLSAIAALIAIPVFHYKYSEWLAGFALRPEPHWWLYVLPVTILLLIAVLTVWVQSKRIINLNPVENLKYE